MKCKCISCGHVFNSVEQGEVICPQCGSNNTAILPSSNKTFIVILSILVLIILGSLAAVFIINNKSDKTPGQEAAETINIEDTVDAVEEVSEVTEPAPLVDQLEGLQDMPEAETEAETETAPEAVSGAKAEAQVQIFFKGIKVVSTPVYDAKKKTFTFAVKAELNKAIAQPITYKATIKGVPVVSKNGIFQNVSVAPGSTVKVFASVEGDPTITPVSVNVTGFVAKEETKAEAKETGGAKDKVTLAQVQGWINDFKSGGSANNPLLDTRGNMLVSPKCQYTLNGLNEEDAGLVHARADKIKEKFYFEEWRGVTVTSIKCDPNTGVLIAVTGTVQY